MRRKWEAFYALEALVRRRHAERPRPLAHLALLLTAACLVVLCGFNDAFLLTVPQFQAVAQSLFCVVIGGLYAIYMLTSLLARAVMHCSGEPQRRAADEEDALCEEEEADFDVLRHQHMTRDQVVASMYLGGVGAFLALAPLCMWNCAITLTFLVSLLGVALMIEPATMGHTAWLLMGASALTLGCAIAIECTLPMRAYTTNRHNATGLPRSVALLLLDQQAQQRAWPAWMMLSSVSPPLLYAGLGGGNAAGSLMTPAKTLETGLPVSLLLACVLLGWFNPIESALWADAHHVLGQPRLLLLLFLAPLLLVSVLAFLMHALRSRSVLPALAVLTAVLAARQQALRASPPRALDAASLTFAVVALIAAGGRLRASFAFPMGRRT